MKVLSLFDGIACARLALESAGIKVHGYFASEIEEKAITIAQKNWPDHKQLGDVTKLKVDKGGIVWEGGGFTFSTKIDLLIGGSPCQDLSVAKTNRQGLKGERSKLFYEYVRLLRELKPKWWLLENVANMTRENRDAITKELGVEPIMIDAALVSAQSRKRLFWTNIPNVGQPEDRKIYLKDVIEDGYVLTDKAKTITKSYLNGASIGNLGTHRERTLVLKNKPIPLLKVPGTTGGQGTRIYSIEGKSVTVPASRGGNKTGLYLIRKEEIRSLYPVEVERLQCVPDGYTEGIPKTWRIGTLGNAFNVEVIAHILRHIK